jgi:hypothetical protein
MDMRSDLSELKSTGQTDETGAVPLGWPELESQRQVSRQLVRMLGYMMDGYQPAREGTRVEMFILLPEAGQFLHPAHRIPNQMVEVRPRQPVVFRYRDLVWASGILSPIVGLSRDQKAAYTMTAAEVKPASQRDIGRWFHP